MDEAQARLWQRLVAQLRGRPPAFCRLLAPEGTPFAGWLARDLPETTTGGTPPPGSRVPLALVAGLIETLEAEAARERLSRLRDLEAEHVVLLVDLARSPLPDPELRALGYRPHARDGDHALYGFDLYDYKDRPEWLNPKHWAHPERWDKFRW